MIGSSTVALLLLTSSVAYVIHRFIDYRRTVKFIGDFPGYRLLLAQSSLAANILAPNYVPGIATGSNMAWKVKYKHFAYFGADITSHVSIWPRAIVNFNIADPAAIKEITSSRALWYKPIEQYAMVLYFGRNIIATEGDEWKKHRKIANPAFSEPNNKLVWSEAVRITMDMIENVWNNKEAVEFDHVVDVTLPIALLVIASAGFGRHVSLSEDMKVPPGHEMAFKDALHIVSTDMIIPILVPKWVPNVSQRLRNVRVAMAELRKYMREMIDERRNAETKPGSHDLFSKRLDANMEESADSTTRLSDDEFIADIFIFLLAGHETTAHTLCFTLGFPALYQDQQEILYQHIMSVFPDNMMPTYEDMGTLSYVLAVFYCDSSRRFVTVIPKKAAMDLTLDTTNHAGERVVIPVPKGAEISLHTPGLHYNPRYWKDPFEFGPQRFMEDWPQDAFLPFSGGARACMGRRFPETEAIAILAVLVARYRVVVKDEPEFAGETFDQKRERLLEVKPGIRLT